MKILEIRSSLYPGSVIKIPLNAHKSILRRLLRLLKVSIVLGAVFAAGAIVGYDRGNDAGYRSALYQVYRIYNTTEPVRLSIAGAGGEGRVWNGK